MFILDRSLPGIQALESEVDAVYRSKLPNEIPLDGLPPVVCECFVCLVRKEEKRVLFHVLYLKDSRKCLVYVPDGSLPAEAYGEERFREAAMELSKALGFTMERVNLKYGTALREVMVRSLPVIMSPEAFRKALMPSAGSEGRPAAPAESSKAGSTGNDEGGQTPLEAEKARAEALSRKRIEALSLAVEKIRSGLASSRETAAARAAAARQEEERVAAEQAAAERQFASLQKEQERLAAEKAGVEKRTSELTRAVRLAEERLAAERRERERLAAEKKEAENRAAELARAVRLSEERLAAERTEREKLKAGKVGEERLAAEKAAAEARAADFAESVRLAEERLAAERSERERLGSEKKLAERQLRELERAVHLAEEKTAVERAEKERLVAERRHGEHLEAEKRELELKLKELLTSYREAVDKFEAERSDRERLASEKSLAERELKDLSKALHTAREKALDAPAARAQVEQLLAAKAEAEARAEELTQALRATRERAESERQERERLAAEKSLAEKQLGDVAAKMERGQEKSSGDKVEKKGLPRLDWHAGARARQPSQGGPPPGAPSRSSVPGATFQVDWRLPFVGYSAPEEVVEIYQSIGPSQLSLEGFPSQYCSAFVIGLNKGGRPRVYVAFFLHADNRILVYVPSRDPVGQAGFEKAKKEGMQFLQLAGYMLDRVPLGRGGESRARMLESIPVLGRPASNVQGF